MNRRSFFSLIPGIAAVAAASRVKPAVAAIAPPIAASTGISDPGHTHPWNYHTLALSDLPSHCHSIINPDGTITRLGPHWG